MTALSDNREEPSLPINTPRNVVLSFIRMAMRWELPRRPGRSASKQSAGRTAAPKRFLIACDHLLLSGGMLRMERMAEHLVGRGHEVCYLAFAPDKPPAYPTALDVLSFEEAALRSWDCTMVPGAGFPDETMEALTSLREPNFGLRLQHVLNDRTQRPAFLKVNASFRPDLVIFNNRDWKPGDFTDFDARKFHFLEGAVDMAVFHPAPNQAGRGKKPKSRLTIGTQAKWPALEPVARAIALLPGHVRLHVFGGTPSAERLSSLRLDDDRLRFSGALNDADLRDFYQRCDLVIHAEASAGWANMAAEAMACAVPVICTAAGTGAFARHLETAWVLDEITPEEIATAIGALETDSELRRSIAARGRKAVEPFSWEKYAASLLELCDDDGGSHYTHAPELGLHGKWPAECRFEGLEPVIAACEGKSVLDLGCAEGVVARQLLQNGAACVHGFDSDPSRIEEAERLCAGLGEAVFRPADLARWGDFAGANAELLRNRYDIVLYLGLHHHLPPATRREGLAALLSLTGEMIVIRTPRAVWQSDDLDRLLDGSGFDCRRVAAPRLSVQGDLAICTPKSLDG